jgi:hypothetical protein
LTLVSIVYLGQGWWTGALLVTSDDAKVRANARAQRISRERN